MLVTLATPIEQKASVPYDAIGVALSRLVESGKLVVVWRNGPGEENMFGGRCSYSHHVVGGATLLALLAALCRVP